MSKTTIKDIAQRVGVSKSLVSMYLNHHPLSAHIAPLTKARIDEAVAETGYRPSIVAQAFKRGRSKTIGLVLGNITSVYFSYYASALMYEALRYDYQLIVSLTRYNQEEERRCLLNLMDRQTDGIIYHLHFHPDDRYRRLVSGYPLLLATSNVEKPEYNSIMPDVRSACEGACSSLSAAGFHHLVGLDLGDSFWTSIAEDVSPKHGLSFRAVNRHGRDDASFYGELFSLQPDCVLSSSSITALAFLRYCKRHRIGRIPRVVYSYTLPNDLIEHEAVFGALVNNFQEKISGTMKRILEMIEHPEGEVRNLLYECAFLPVPQLREHYEQQMIQLDFANILAECDKSI